MTASSDHDHTDHESDSDSSIILPEALALGREKRQNAGNRLRDMLNRELEREEVFAEEVDDGDFDSDQDKQSDLESELSSSSDAPPPAVPGGQDDDDEGERALKEQERIARRAKRKQPHHQAKKQETARPVKRTRVPVQHHVGEKRSSVRSHAVRVADEVEKRLVADARKARPVTAREEVVPLTQAERLEEAKLTEKRNVDSLNSLVRDEEEKKAQQRALALRKRIVTPTVRHISRADQSCVVFEHVEVDDPTALLLPHTPTTRPPRWTCPFTGRPAKYHDPATGVYYYDAAAFAGLKRITSHEVGWSGELSSFVEPSVRSLASTLGLE